MRRKRVLIPVILLGLVGSIALAYHQFLKPASPEYAQYNQEAIVASVESQLAGMDRQMIRSKAPLILEKGVEELQASIKEGQLTYEDLTAFYLDRIQEIDQKDKGINAFVEIHPQALEIARSFDKDPQKAEKQANQPLYGLPITLKDNIFTKELPSSAGLYILKDFRPEKDARLVEELKAAGAFVLGKVNLSELANFVSVTMPDGYSSKGGQTVNPFKPLKATPSGSSSGSAASLTSNIGLLSIGTETTGSILSPANIQSVVGFKPSRHALSSQGVFPLSSSLDTAGPMARTVKDVVYAYNSMTQYPDQRVKPDSLKANYLVGKRIGILKGAKQKGAAYDRLKNILGKFAVETVEVEFDNQGIQNGDIITKEFSRDVEAFAAEQRLPFKTLAELIAYNEKDEERRAKYGQSLLQAALEGKDGDQEAIQAQIRLAKKRLEALRKEHKLDAILMIGDEGLELSAVAGYPAISIPFGMNDKGLPEGVTLYGFGRSDGKLLRLAYSFEQASKGRILPDIK